MNNERMGRLLEAARAGDRESLNELVRELTPLLWHVARAQGLDRESSSDVVQHTWLTLLKSISDIRSPAALTGWLVQVTKREAWRVARRARAEEPVDGAEFADLLDRSPTPEDLATTADTHRELWTALAQLSERCQEILRAMAFLPELTYTELSALLNIARGSIGPMRGRCLVRLRSLLTGGVRDER
ncbi:RNA polymerase sigma factor [Lentzea rhizosphaerae]|uniref:RNA polymerase sigma factor n=1 Tax=Lentzea rhizosphaerae TaxID=2041025 RepID=A0ABV8BJB3_9PSEU